MPGARAHAAYLAYRTGAELARVLPPSVAEPVGRNVSRAMARAWPRKRAQVARNLVRASRGALRGDALDRAVDTVFANYARYWHELFRLADAPRGRLLDGLSVLGVENLDASVRAGRGTILALPHLGNWDLAGAWLGESGYRPAAVAEPVAPPELFEWFVRVRAALGVEIVALGPGAIGDALRVLHDNRVLCLLCDRDLIGDGVTVDLFGGPARLPGGPAALALRTGAGLLPTGNYLGPGGTNQARIGVPLDTGRVAAPGGVREGFRPAVARVTQALATAFEALIGAEPEQWLMMQPVWERDRLAAGLR